MAERPEDLNLPNSVVARIIKEAVPDGVNVSKEARSAISRAASIFVLYTTTCANNFALSAKRKTLTAADVLSAMEEMEFEHFVEPLKDSLEAFRKDRKEATEKKKKSKSAAESKESEKDAEDKEAEKSSGEEEAEEEEEDDDEEEEEQVEEKEDGEEEKDES
ncbi:DNA polymerase epsilon subunit 3-like [Saccoglossus kowalevskii]|uniref:DNA polymerase epsilon subunit 3 n=1 Tax=Saccoglossus kowalevskii TaxID=10224 RepID=A0ABM0GRU0_SACKO|nr:PREDICTED: DNA polymerase epsilon subunit 3-like [Saccoglossus kowalevskii]